MILSKHSSFVDFDNDPKTYIAMWKKSVLMFWAFNKSISFWNIKQIMNFIAFGYTL